MILRSFERPQGNIPVISENSVRFDLIRSESEREAAEGRLRVRVSVR